MGGVSICSNVFQGSSVVCACCVRACVPWLAVFVYLLRTVWVFRLLVLVCPVTFVFGWPSGPVMVSRVSLFP